MTSPKTLSGNAVGALWMLASAACFTAMAVLLKLLANAHYPDSQMVFFRTAAGLFVMLPFLLRAPKGVWKISRPGLLFVRCALSTIGVFASFYSFAHMPLADAQAISFSRVLFITIFAVWLLHEAVGVRRWAAVAVGFIGVLMMVQPHGDSQFGLPAMMQLVAALSFGLTIVMVKDLTRDHAPTALIFYTNAFTTLAGIPFAFLAWVTPTPVDLVYFIVLGLVGVAGQSCYIRALTVGDASLMGILDYTRLPMAIGVGLLIFHEAPDPLVLAGAVVIIVSTGYITWREARLAKPIVIAPPLSGPDKEIPP